MAQRAFTLGRLAFFCLSISQGADAQLYGSFLTSIQQKPPEGERLKAEAQHARADPIGARVDARPADASEPQTEPSDHSAVATRIPAWSDDFMGKHVPKYRLENGVTLQASGGFRPSDAAHCISDCFVPLQQSH